MKTVSQIGISTAKESGGKGFAVDTTFVLFFLAIEFGQTFGALGFDSVFLALTLLIVAVAPYFLLGDEKPNFANWLIGRSFITALAILLGWMFKQSLGVALPEMFRFLPMTLLIITAILSCYVQFYSFLNLREAE